MRGQQFYMFSLFIGLIDQIVRPMKAISDIRAAYHKRLVYYINELNDSRSDNKGTRAFYRKQLDDYQSELASKSDELEEYKEYKAKYYKLIAAIKINDTEFKY